MNVSASVVALDRLGDDDAEGALRDMEEAKQQWSQDDFHVHHHDAVYWRALIDLYQGNGELAWDRISAYDRVYRHSLLMRIQVARVQWLFGRGLCALAAARAAPRTEDCQSLLRQASRMAKRLGRERAAWASGFGRLIEAGIEWQNNNTGAAATSHLTIGGARGAGALAAEGAANGRQ